MPKVTDAHVAARRRQIMSAALRCFSRDGFHRTSMQDIFREAGLSPGAVYSYFASKDELVRAIITDTFAFITETADLLTDPLPDGRLRKPGEALAEMIERYQQVQLGSVEERARLFPYLIGEQQRDPALNAAARAALDRLASGFAALAHAARQRGDLGTNIHPDDVGRIAVSLLQGGLIQYSVYGDQVDLDTYRRALVTLVDGQPSRPGPQVTPERRIRADPG